MKICPECYTSVYGSDKKVCPYCGVALDEEEERSTSDFKASASNTSTVKIIGVFSLIAICLVLSIFSIDWLAKNGLNLSMGRNCGNNEQCFLTGFAICEVEKEVNPNSYGLLSAKIVQDTGDMCIVKVNALAYDTEKKADLPTDKVCVFKRSQLNETKMDDLFFCENYNISDLNMKMSDQEWSDLVAEKTRLGDPLAEPPLN